MSKGAGKIVECHRNYGQICTSSFKRRDEYVPFAVTPDLIEEEGGNSYFVCGENVEFTLARNDNVRDRQIKVAEGLSSTGGRTVRYERPRQKTYFEYIRDVLSDHLFALPCGSNPRDVGEYLKSIGFQPKMLEYLTCQGVFVARPLLEIFCPDILSMPEKALQFNPELLIVLDHVDDAFKSLIVEWVVGLEASFKAALFYMALDCGRQYCSKLVNEWGASTCKHEKQVKRARAQRMFRLSSDQYDYVGDEHFAPLEDLLGLFDLSDLVEFIHRMRSSYTGAEASSAFTAIYDNVDMLADLRVLRNAAAHGRPLIPMFMDPDYNANWDLDFDNPTGRTNQAGWTLYEPMRRYWEARGLSEYADNIISTVFCNPVRRAWAELNYLYCHLMKDIDRMAYDRFMREASHFLQFDDPLDMDKLSRVNPLDLKLSDMGPTTLEPLTGLVPPYKEIANEAYAVWETCSTD